MHSRSAVFRGRDPQERHKETFWSDGNVLYLHCGNGYTIVNNCQIQQIAHLKGVDFIGYKLSFDKAGEKQICSAKILSL